MPLQFSSQRARSGTEENNLFPHNFVDIDPSPSKTRQNHLHHQLARQLAAFVVLACYVLQFKACRHGHLSIFRQRSQSTLPRVSTRPTTNSLPDNLTRPFTDIGSVANPLVHQIELFRLIGVGKTALAIFQIFQLNPHSLRHRRDKRF